MQRAIFLISDRTGITAEALGNSLLSQFQSVSVRRFNLPFIDTVEKANHVVEEINKTAQNSENRPIVFSTLVDPELRRIIGSANAAFFDLFEDFVLKLEKELGVASSRVLGYTHGLGDSLAYGIRMNAVNFALANDDGAITKNYPSADIILTGVSRSGKTPTCLYLGLQFGVRAANYPITEEDLGEVRLPNALIPHRKKLYGLTIDPERLQKIRHERRPNSPYSSIRQCRYETERAETLFQAEHIPYLSTTTLSVEEIAATLLSNTGLRWCPLA